MTNTEPAVPATSVASVSENPPAGQAVTVTTAGQAEASATYQPAGELLAGTSVVPPPATLSIDTTQEATGSENFWLMLVAATLALGTLAIGTGYLGMPAGPVPVSFQNVAGQASAMARQLWAGREGGTRRVADHASVANLRADLHDGPAQHLAYALMHLEEIEPRDAQDGDHRREAFKKVATALKAALEETREIASGTSLPAVRRLDPASVITSAIRNHETMTHTSVERQITGLPSALAPSVKVCLYRFTQEGLNNAYRHARGKGQKLTIKLAGNEILAEVADEGPGAADAAAKSGRLGLAGLRQRAEAAGGKLELVSEPGKGTKLVLRLPAAKRADDLIE